MLKVEINLHLAIILNFDGVHTYKTKYQQHSHTQVNFYYLFLLYFWLRVSTFRVKFYWREQGF